MQLATLSEVQAFLQVINVSSEGVLTSKTLLRIPLQVIRIPFNQFPHPVLFRFGCLDVAVAVAHLNFIHCCCTHKLWKVLDSIGSSKEISQGMFN